MRKIVPILCILALSLSGCRATTLLRNGVDELRDYIASENAKTKKKLNDRRNEKISTLNRAISEKNEEIIFELMADDLREDGDKLKSQLKDFVNFIPGKIVETSNHSWGTLIHAENYKDAPDNVMSNENKNTNVKEETTWTNFKFFNNQVKLKVIEKDDRQMYLADCRFMPGSVANGIDLGDQNGISGHMTVFLTEKQYFKAAEQKANGEQINVGLPSTQLKDGKIEVNFYNHESKEARTIPVNPFAASKANKAAREAFFERKDAEREQGKSLGAKAASARGASEKLDGQSQAAPAKDNLEH